MPTFKHKDINSKNNQITIDGKHRELLYNFYKNEHDIIPKLKKDKLELKELLITCENIEERLQIIDKIKTLNVDIQTIKHNKKQYLLENSKYIFDYFESKKKIATSNNGSINTNNKVKNKVIDTFFKISPKPIEECSGASNNLVYKYFKNIDSSIIDMSNFIYQSDICKHCNNGELVPYEDEGILICVSCSASIPYLIENEKPTYKEPPKEVCFYAYKRINHFKEIISQFQGKETTQISQEIINKITLQIKKERIQQSELTNDKMKEILKKLGYSKYYEHIPFIKDKLGIKPPVMSPELEDTLFNLFIELQRPYSKYCPDDRVNFLNYYYTAYKLCELLGETIYLSEFPMLKDREKIIEQDSIWKNMCLELDWNFIPTI
jgi:hypothetical protein